MEVERRSSELLDTAAPSFLATVSNSSTPKTVSQNDAVQSSPVQFQWVRFSLGRTANPATKQDRKTWVGFNDLQ